MDESMDENLPEQELPQAVVTKERTFSLVWLVPLTAALVALWLIVSSYWERGTTVTITFDSANGVVAGKTKVKYKDVDIGLVEDVRLGKGLSNVVVEAVLDKSVSRYLLDNTRFWVVQPRLSLSGVSGLNTLVSGVFLEMEPGNEGASTFKFKGLNVPPVLRVESEGQEFVVTSDKLGSLSAGSPVSYHGIHVGEVLGYQLDENQQNIKIHVFIREPYHRLVTSTSRFWNASGFSVMVTPEGLTMKTESMQSLLVGGIAFDTPGISRESVPAARYSVFPLFSDPGEATETPTSHKLTYVVYFQGSVRGLKSGALVEYQGIPIGAVREIRLAPLEEAWEFRVSVLIELEPEKFLGKERSTEAAHVAINHLVERGLRARLMGSGLLPGPLFVELGFHPESAKLLVGGDHTYPELPAITGNIEGITNDLASVLRKVDQIPLEQIGKEVQETVHGLNQTVNAPEIMDALRGLNRALRQGERLMADMDQQVIPISSGVKALSQSTTVAMDHAGKALVTVDRLLSADSPLHRQLVETLKELSATAYSLRTLSNTLQRNPEALLFGKEKGKK